MVNVWSDAFREAINTLSTGIVAFVPKLIIAVVIFAIGWAIGAVIAKVVAQVIRSLKVDSLLRTLHVEEVLKRAGLSLDSGEFVGALLKWFVIIIFLMASLELMGLNQVTDVLRDIVSVKLPNVIIAVLILLAAVMVAEFVERAVVHSARAAEARNANFLGAVARWTIWISASFAVLAQLNVAADFVGVLLRGVITAISVALGLAFGLGGQDAAAKFIDKVKQDIANR